MARCLAGTGVAGWGWLEVAWKNPTLGCCAGPAIRGFPGVLLLPLVAVQAEAVPPLAVSSPILALQGGSLPRQ